MAEYSAYRRSDAIPALKAITKNEAFGMTEVVRERAWEKAREAVADELRQQGKPRRNFAELIKKKR